MIIKTFKVRIGDFSGDSKEPFDAEIIKDEITDTLLNISLELISVEEIEDAN